MHQLRQTYAPSPACRRQKWIATTVLVCVMLAAFTTLYFLASSPASAKPGQLTGTIAYADMAGDSIRLIEPDGSNDRALWTHAASNEFFRGFLGLDWHPNATELVFSSRHQNTCSNYQADLFTIRPDGSGERRITNPPSCERLADYPKGSVTFTIRNEVSDRAVFFIYVEGAPETVIVTVSPGTTELVTVHNVADFGPGQIQYVSALNGFISWIQPDVYADVQAGSEVTIDSVLVIEANRGRENWDAVLPNWHRSGDRIAFALGRAIPASIPADPAIGYDGDLLFALEAGATGNYNSWSPVSDELLLAYGGNIHLGEAGADAVQLLVQVDSTQLTQGLDWLPDGSGFVFGVTSGEFSWEQSNLYLYEFADDESAGDVITPLTNYTGQFAGYPSVSADGNYVVFSVGADIDAGGELWVLALDGSELYSLGVSGFWPNWSSRTPSLPAPEETTTPEPGPVIDGEELFLPLILR